MGGLALVVLFGLHPTGGKFHETVLRANIVGMWRLHAFDGTLTDPVYASATLYRPNGRYIWAHGGKNSPRKLRAGSYSITGDLLKVVGDPGGEMPPGLRVLSMPDRDTLRIDFTNGRETSWNLHYRIKTPQQASSQEYSYDEFTQSVRRPGRGDE